MSAPADLLDAPPRGGSVRARLRLMLPAPDPAPDAAPDPAFEGSAGLVSGPGAGDGGWAAPGVTAVARDADGLSPRVATALAEAREAFATLRGVQDRCYRSLDELGASGAADETGHRSTRRLVEEHLHLDPAEATRLLRQAQALLPHPLLGGGEQPAALPATAENLVEGRLGPAHVAVIERTHRAIERMDHVDTATRDEVERQLAALAVDRTPSALAAAAAEVLALLDPDGAAPTDTDLPTDELHLATRRDGSLTGRFTYRDPVAAAALRTAIDAATPPATADGDPTPGDPTSGDPLRTLPERRAHALRDLASEALTRGGPDEPDQYDQYDEHGERGVGEERGSADDKAGEPDQPDQYDEPGEHGERGVGEERGSADDKAGEPGEPGEPDQYDESGARGERGSDDGADGRRDETATHARTRPDTEGGERVHLAVTIDWELLRSRLTNPAPGWGHGALPGLGHLDPGVAIGPETARRLACDADILPAVLGARGEPLDIGRRTRLVPAALRRALVLRDRHCTHPGCRRRARRTQAHHVVHWAHGGPTSLENLVLLCAFHHALAHHGGWRISFHDGLPWFTPPRWLDRHQRPRHNRPWDPTTTPTQR